jgi:hypothetical protein
MMMRRRGRAVRSFSGLVLVAVLLGGCSKTLDMAKIESEIEKGIESQTGVKVKSVNCPESREVKKGDTFKCTAVGEDGSTAPVGVTQTSDDGDIDWKLNP